MIPGIEVDTATESQIWRSFESWADHFRTRLRTSGVDGLIAAYQQLVESVETESCSHGPNGSRLVGSAWSACCGLSYEFTNDVSVRDALEHFLKLASAAMPNEKIAAIAHLDDRLYERYPVGTARENGWWHFHCL